MGKNKVNLDQSLFDYEHDRSEEWRGMPDFNQPDNGAFRQIIVSFDNQEGVAAFAKAIGQDLTAKTKSIWYPPRERNTLTDLFWFDTRDEDSNGSA